jgi:ABC-type transport system substrate-binding protein
VDQPARWSRTAAFRDILLHNNDELRHMNIYVEDLKAIGIRPRIEQLSYASWTKRVDEHDFDLAWMNWAAVRLRDPKRVALEDCE